MEILKPQILIVDNGIKVYHSDGVRGAFIGADALYDAIVKYSNSLTEQSSNVAPVSPDKGNECNHYWELLTGCLPSAVYKCKKCGKEESEY